jgi:hypothetical protein
VTVMTNVPSEGNTIAKMLKSSPARPASVMARPPTRFGTKAATDPVNGVLTKHCRRTDVIVDKTTRAPKKIGAMKERLALMLLIAAAVSACGNAAIGPVAMGPVDHECHGNRARSQGSGCEDNP